MELQLQIAEKMNECVASAIGSEACEGFVKAFKMAQAVEKLYELLTPEYMAPIMKLQGTRLGFKTDRDTEGGYGIDVVKRCLIEAVLMGVQPTGNQFNIIAGDAYITKEGYGHKLRNMPGLTSCKITPSLPRINGDRTSGAVLMKITYTYNGAKGSDEIDVPVKLHPKAGTTDVAIGKATRKARAHLFTTITGSEMPEGDIMDTESEVVKSTVKEADITHDELVKLYQEHAAKLSIEEQANAARIMTNREKNSYAKLHKLILERLSKNTADEMPT